MGDHTTLKDAVSVAVKAVPEVPRAIGHAKPRISPQGRIQRGRNEFLNVRPYYTIVCRFGE